MCIWSVRSLRRIYQIWFSRRCVGTKRSCLNTNIGLPKRVVNGRGLVPWNSRRDSQRWEISDWHAPRQSPLKPACTGWYRHNFIIRFTSIFRESRIGDVGALTVGRIVFWRSKSLSRGTENDIHLYRVECPRQPLCIKAVPYLHTGKDETNFFTKHLVAASFWVCVGDHVTNATRRRPNNNPRCGA